MTLITASMLMGYADGELNAVDRTRVEEAAASNAELREELAKHQRLRGLLSDHYDPILDQDVPERLRAVLDTNVIAIGDRRERPNRSRWHMPTAMAASLVAGLIAGQTLQGTSDGFLKTEEGLVLASGELAHVLETQLASEQSASSDARIGISFAAEDGRFCRTFEAASVSGLACRRNDEWQVLASIGRTPVQDGQYRQAGAETVVMGLAQDLVATAPLDAEAERRARDLGWRSSRSR